jgi:uncharacterized protein with GYD domain
MTTYFMFGKYSLDSIQKINAQRTNEAAALVKSNGGEIKAGYALLGEHDLVLIVDFPGPELALKTSVALAKLLGISFTTAAAISMADFDKLVG